MPVSDTLSQWLRGQFKHVSDVKRVSTQPDSNVIFQHHRADFVVSTWMGARLYVYLIHEMPKYRDIKNTLRENSRDAIGTLFIVNKHLLPADEATIKLVDWQDALQSLHDGYIYAYTLRDDSLHIDQIHYTPLNRNNEFRVWHFNKFNIEAVTVRKRDISEGVRGTWYVGDIASPNYKRRVNNERANQRFHYRTKYTQDIPGSNGNGHANGQFRRRDDELAKYYALLGVDKDANEQQIKAAFRQQALKVHPDVSALPRSESERRIKELNEAYEYIKQHHNWR